MICAVTLLLLTASAAPAGQGVPLPRFTPGLWQFTRTVPAADGAPDSTTSTRCTDPTDDMNQQNAKLVRAGCTFSPIVKQGDRYTLVTRCTIAGGGVASTSVITASSTASYRIDITTVAAGSTTRETLTAVRLGDCEPS
jgi:Protein of unknown function (DUF3617)